MPPNRTGPRRTTTSAWQDLIRTIADAVRTRTPRATPEPPSELPPYRPIARVLLTDEAGRRLFEEYAAHRQSERGREEIGWMLLGHREGDTATVLATLPAGAERDAGEEHVKFNSEAQALASRIVRQADRRLTLLGVVHTHPGTLRHPSRGDLRGDRNWVKGLRGKQGVFAIGTVDEGTGDVAERPKPHVQAWQGLRFDWYTLAEGDDSYRPAAIELTIGPDLASSLRPVWPAIEAHAGRLERIVRQQAGVRFEIAEGCLIAIVPLAEPARAIRLLLEEKRVRFLYESDGEVFQADLPAGTEPDRGVYLLLAELTK